ncbi:hypothetical protein VOLCADRAFT_89728 [Volvox carteri f. nagariensis]|uniref:Uncharacterized protein n=1 Tax=Volvox carteri f. nagariensis TaxID=3068 RepID=D8TSH2_VOLCA|nr:uncharacterized protein VOLCADRAFT_89728 [Volvox carteri f. nagariensis]EFJ49486.1 hypothetical protein VOLCADRAFT_89728 [Volvox carteri f. nagariensis]|eukprot:XP_002949467.1 hypothetical protein VOLCADRAFT_89728 [Volvox carteri f. nagariensis]
MTTHPSFIEIAVQHVQHRASLQAARLTQYWLSNDREKDPTAVQDPKPISNSDDGALPALEVEADDQDSHMLEVLVIDERSLMPERVMEATMEILSCANRSMADGGSHGQGSNDSYRSQKRTTSSTAALALWAANTRLQLAHQKDITHTVQCVCSRICIEVIILAALPDEELEKEPWAAFT